MIDVTGPPEEWAGDVARLMVDRDRPVSAIQRFFEAVFGGSRSS